MLTTMSTVIAVPGHVEAVQRPELLDRHPVARDPVERTAAVGGRRVHRDDEARDQADDEEVGEARRADDLVHRPRIVVAPDELRAGAADEPDREHDVDDHREQRGRAERELRVAHRVLVLGREGRTDVDPPGRPAHQPEPDERELKPAPREPRVAQLVRQVGAVEAAVQERQDHHHEQRHHQKDAGGVAERDADAGAEDVEQPDARGSARSRSAPATRPRAPPVEK